MGEYLTEKKEEREAAARRTGPARAWRRIASIAAIVACGVVWLMPSLGTQPTQSISAERTDASARLTLYLASRRVRAFEESQGRLPNTASESGITDRRITYRLTDTSAFSLSMSDGLRRWVLASTEADTAYLHDAMRRLGAAPK